MPPTVHPGGFSELYVSILWEFIEDWGGSTHHAIMVTSSSASSPMLSATPIESSHHAHVKTKPMEASIHTEPPIIKQESFDLTLLPPTTSIRTCITGNNSQEVIEILDSSDEDLYSDSDIESINDMAMDPDSDSSELDDDLSIQSDAIPTVWLDDDVKTIKIISG
ncbi:hypothetical protein BDQ17DRAFT_1340081, partial [Cyathus striatus]